MEKILEGFFSHLAVDGFRLSGGFGVEAGFQGVAEADIGRERCRLVSQATVTDHEPAVKLFCKVVDVKRGPVACAGVVPPIRFLKFAPERNDKAEKAVSQPCPRGEHPMLIFIGKKVATVEFHEASGQGRRIFFSIIHLGRKPPEGRRIDPYPARVKTHPAFVDQDGVLAE
jgi:hypothetical protein